MRYEEITCPAPLPKVVIEHAVEKPGDWDGASVIITSISEFIFEKNWQVVGTIAIEGSPYTIAYFGDTSTHYVIGSMQDMLDGAGVKKRFAVVLRIELNREDELSAKLNCPKLHTVFAVAVRPEMQAQRIARRMYRWLVHEQGMTILVDRTQYFGARRLWAALSRDTDVVVDIVDAQVGSVVERGVTLHHGRYDHDFDTRVWSYGRDLANVRLVLRDVLA